MIKQLAIVIIVIIGIVAIAASRRPDAFRVQRSVVIAAPPATVYALISDFRNWGAWSPWEKLDPNMQRTMSGAPNGVGAIYEWNGNGKAGAGRMEIKEATPSSKVLIQLDFMKPIKSSSSAEFTLTGQNDSTKVEWAMYGPSPFVSKVMQVFISMDDMIGKDFESGLASMKTVAEKPKA